MPPRGARHAASAKPSGSAAVTGVTHDIFQPLQIAMAPNMQTVMLALDDEAISFKVEHIERCEWIELGDASAGFHSGNPDSQTRTLITETPAPHTYSQDPGTPVFMSFTSTDGHRLTQVSVDNRQGRSCFTTAGTRWDIHGLESFENGRSVYLHHLDNPTLEQRVIIWP
ncbi:MAG: hypothetical protein H7210_07255, partial [Pyrinomonadaceae bacterium]|nr:hypothetical protein [Phycisphaerales bacterium]